MWTFLPSNVILLSKWKKFPNDYLRAVEPENSRVLQSFPKERSPTHEADFPFTGRNSNLPDWTWVLIT